jgi:hypothetical protein
MSPRGATAAISAQQQPRHQPACREPIWRALRRPSRHVPSRNPSGLRHFALDVDSLRQREVARREDVTACRSCDPARCVIAESLTAVAAPSAELAVRPTNCSLISSNCLAISAAL